MDEQKTLALSQFKERIQDCHLIDRRDEYLLKWLKARDFNVNEAEKMLRNSLVWRKANGVDEVLQTWSPPEVLQKYFSFGNVGHDKFDCPIFICAHGRTDIRGIMQSITKKDYMRFQMWNAEKINFSMREEFEKTGKNPHNYLTMIADMEHLSMRQMAYKPAMDAGMEQTKVYEAHYPETLRRIFIINAPKLFMFMYNMMKVFMHQATIDKMKIFGSDKEEWTAALLEEIDADQLPAFYGGTMVDPDGDPKCPSKFNMGGEVPLSYYMSNSAPVAKDYMESANIIAGAGGWKKLKFKVDVPNSILRWEFMTEGGDIGFRVYYKDPVEGIDDLIPLDRIESHLVTEEGQIICGRPGKYVVTFDNTFSLLRPKKVRYYIVVDPPVPGGPVADITG